MSQFAVNSIHFAADCVQQNGECTVALENILFLDDGREHAAIDHLQRKCSNVVIIPDTSDKGQALLYHTSCRRMTDAVSQIFQEYLGAPASLPHPPSEMMVGEPHRRYVTLSYDACKVKVERYRFQSAPQK